MKRPHAMACAAFILGTPAWAQITLPDGPGKELVSKNCGTCHAMSRVTEAGYTAEEWRNSIHMMKNVGATVQAGEIDAMVAYLAKNFPAKPLPAPGAVTEHRMPDTAARDPHTPIFDRDGILWFTVQAGNFVGRLDPKSGEVKLVPSPTPRSRPYGILVNLKNVPFWVEFGSNKVASIDRDTMAIREYALPDPASRPRRIAITPDDAVWYTDYARPHLGRFNPATGLVDEWPSPGGPKSQPYGMLADGEVIWYSESGVKPNTLVRFDPRTQKFQSWIIPSGGGVVRHMVRAADGKFALALSGVNGVALVEKQ